MLDRNKFLLQVKMPNMQRCHGYWRRIPNYWKNMSNGTPARRLWNRWLQLFITLIWYLIIFNQWAEKRSERLAKPAKVTRGKSNLSSWKVPSKIFGSTDIFTNNPDNVITSIPPGETSMKCWRRWQVILGTLQRRQRTKARWVVIEQLMI